MKRGVMPHRQSAKRASVTQRVPATVKGVGRVAPRANSRAWRVSQFAWIVGTSARPTKGHLPRQIHNSAGWGLPMIPAAPAYLSRALGRVNRIQLSSKRHVPVTRILHLQCDINCRIITVMEADLMNISELADAANVSARAI